jgi:hypothetical protein
MEAAYSNTVKQHREIQREKLVAGIVVAVACGAAGIALGLPALAVAFSFLGSVGIVKLVTF